MEVSDTEQQKLASQLASKLVLSLERKKKLTLLWGYHIYAFQELFHQQIKPKNKASGQMVPGKVFAKE